MTAPTSARIATNTAGHALVPDTVRYAFDIGAVVLLAAVCWTVLRTREYPPEELAAHGAAEQALEHVHVAIECAIEEERAGAGLHRIAEWPRRKLCPERRARIQAVRRLHDFQARHAAAAPA